MAEEALEEEVSIPKAGLLGRFRSEFSFVEGNFLIMVLSWLILDLSLIHI